MHKIEITREILGFAGMQVCVEDNCNDDEILEVCNKLNPSGTTGGWQKVVRELDEEYIKKAMLPICCEKYENRTHLIVLC